MNPRLLLRFLTVCLCCVVAVMAFAGEGGKLAPGDMVKISCNEEPLITREYRVTQKGFVLIDFVGAVKVAGLSKTEAAQAISARLVETKVLRQATVKVDDAVASSEDGVPASSVQWAGEVENPGSVPFKAGMTLGEVWAMVKPRAVADTTQVTITNPRYAPRTVGLAGDLLESTVLRAGDVITVGGKPGTTGTVTVSGEVARPGPCAIDPYATLGEVLRNAGGVTPTGNTGKIRLERPNGDSRTYKLPEDASARVYAGDRIVVETRLARFSVPVGGEVKRPGTVELLEGQGVSAAIREAGGFGPHAAKDRVRLFVAGQTQPRIVNFTQIELGYSGDIPLKAGSRIEVQRAGGGSDTGWKVAAGAVLLFFLLGR